MQSKVAQEVDLALAVAMRRLTPEQRLDAFLEHCELMMELFHAGQQAKLTSRNRSE